LFFFPRQQDSTDQIMITTTIKPTLAKSYDGQDVSGWLMSEKLDGVRAIWNGEDFISRNGNVFDVPESFKAAMPSVALDGELWMGRGKLQETVSVIRSGKQDPRWEQIKFHVFDAPMFDATFQERIKYCAELLESNLFAVAVPHSRCGSQIDLHLLCRQIVSDGAEGLMVRDPNSQYIQGRTNKLLKYKIITSDEGKVISTTGKLDSIAVEWRGMIVNLGTGFDAATRKNPPAIGSIVTFEYRGFTDSGLPRNTSFVSVRDYE
jgi:DNA ligase-1